MPTPLIHQSTICPKCNAQKGFMCYVRNQHGVWYTTLCRERIAEWAKSAGTTSPDAGETRKADI